jgi:hypothetical protein
MKYIFTSTLVLLIYSANAQLQKNRWTIGTNVPLNFQFKTNGPGIKSYDFTLNPTAGYFVSDTWEVGGGPIVSFRGSRFKDNLGYTTYKDDNTSVGLNLYSRYYFKKDGTVLPYLTVNATYLRTSGNSIDINGFKTNYRRNERQAGAGVGLSWFLSSRAALFSEFNYTGYWGDGLGYTNGVNLKVGFQLFLGKENKK